MRFRILKLFILMTLLTACSGKTPTAAPGSTSPSAVSSATSLAPSATPVPATPTSTPEPMALKVNGEGVPLAEYQAQAKQIAEAQPNTDAAQQRKLVLTELENETLLAQAAVKNGFSLDDAALTAKTTNLASQMGGDQAFNDWLGRMGYSADSFHSALRRSSAADWQRNQIMDAVPSSAEQVHARQILVHSETLANQVASQAKQAGINFATLAYGYDPVAGGDLSWFPKGYLNEQAVEDAAFALQPGQVSDVIKSSIGYHILQVIARETRPLTQDARLVLQKKALAIWLDDAHKQSQIEELVP
jgi:parvulin-like peptidyl-prolyl isomerase